MRATRIIAAVVFTASLLVPAAHAQVVGSRRVELQRHDLGVGGARDGREVIQTIVELEPGTTAPRHTHPGEEIIYVLEGTWEYTLEGKPPFTLTAGDVLFIPAGAIHSAKNVGTTRGVELATYIVEKGKPLLQLATPAPRSVEQVRGASPGEGVMPAQTAQPSPRPPQTTNLFLVEDLDNSSRMEGLAKGDVEALRAVADWTRTFIARPHKDLGRAGPVCPFVPRSLEREVLWLAPERVAGRSMPEVVELMRGYKRLFLDTEPMAGEGGGEGTDEKVIVVVFTDLPSDRAKSLFDEVLKQLAVPSYAEDGILFGPFYKGNEGTAIYNPGFRPFQSPAPVLFVRNGVVSDWKFFLDNEEMLRLWARRYGEAGALALAEEVRRLPWRTRRD